MKQKNLKRKGFGALIATIGFILSPLTWWNDLLVNLPLAFGFAWIIGKLLSFVITVNIYLFLTLTAVGYFLTNVIGFMMMHKGAMLCKNTKKHDFNWKKNSLYALLAFALVLLTIQVGLLDLGETEKLMASVLNISYLK